MMKIPVLIMLGPVGQTDLEIWMSEGKRCAAMDLVSRLQQVEAVGSIHVYSAESDFAAPLEEAGCIIHPDDSSDFHFGRKLRSCIEEIARDKDVLAYFGGASAPLLSRDMITQIVDHVQDVQNPRACVNNFYSTDWAVFNNASLIAAADSQIPTDNSLGWVARTVCGFDITTALPCAASRIDLDTPADLMMISGHPSLGGYLSSWLDDNPLVEFSVPQEVHTLLQTPARTLAMLGRVSSDAARTLEKATQIWTRVYSEERGMRASGRLARGEVTSLMGKSMASWGPGRFIEKLEQLADGVLWDTRVIMAELFEWPSTQDRFAFDLGRSDLLEDRALVDWCDAVQQSSIPILTGGHNVVSGGLLAMLETVFPDSAPKCGLKRQF